jgi:FkbM family methyltransferase
VFVSVVRRLSARLRRTKIVDMARLHAHQEVHHLTRLFAHLSIDLVFDIGANQGQYASMLRSEVGYSGPIVSIEPIPELASGLRQRAKNDPHWHIEQVVVSDTDGERSFNVMQDRECSSLSAPVGSDTSTYSEQTKVQSTIVVESTTLKRLTDKWSKHYPDAHCVYLKLDTQGYDLLILRAAKDELKRFVAFQSELSVKRLYQSSKLLEDALTEYKSFGFDVSALVPNNAGHFPDLIEIDCVMIRRDLVDPGVRQSA